MGDNKKPLILVVDDNSDLREIVASSLSRSGDYVTIESDNGKKALEIFKEKKPLAVVTDYAMPEMNGLELIEGIKAINAQVPVVMITGEAPDAILLKLLRFERFLALHKPFRMKRLQKALDHLLIEPFRNQSGPERRKHFRLDTSIDCKVNEEKDAPAKSLSMGGVMLETKEPEYFRPDEKVTLRLSIGGISSVTGKVAWVEKLSEDPADDHWGVGVEFEEYDAKTEQILRAYLLSEIKKRNLGWFDDEEGSTTR